MEEANINQLVAAQNELGKSIDKSYANMKKDSSSRKNAEYLRGHLQKLEQRWEEFKNNHQQLRQMEVPDHQYFKIKYYEQVESIYKEAKSYIHNMQTKLQQLEDIASHTEIPSVSAPEPSPEQAIRLKRQMVRIKKMDDQLRKAEDELKEDQPRDDLELLKDTIAEDWKKIEQLHEDISVYEEAFTHDYFTQNHYEVMDKKTSEILKTIHKKLNKPAATGKAATYMPLPQIVIPIFEGDYATWTTFHDIFSKVVHINGTLSDTEKMQYLKTHVKGEASRLIQHLNISEANYTTAWDLLKKRYENKRLLLSKLINNILDIPPIQTATANAIKHLHDTINECLEGINNLGLETTTWGPMISQIIANKWDNQTNQLYEQSITAPNDIQSYSEMMTFLVTRFQSLEAISTKYKPVQRQQLPDPSITCTYCKEPHTIYTCPKFRALSIDERHRFVKQKQLCFNCMLHHYNKWCHSKCRCLECKGAHNTLLHKPQQNKKRYPQRSQVSTHFGGKNEDVLLATAIINVRTAGGNYELLRALIDPGSQASFITEAAAQLLQLPRQKISATVSGLGEDQPKVSTAQLSLEIHPRFSSTFKMEVEAVVMAKLTQALPSKPLQDVDYKSWQNHMLADPTFNTTGPIDIIIGAEEYGNILLDGLHRSEDGLLGQNTKLGWILSGVTKKQTNTSYEIVSMVTVAEMPDISKFWELEETSQATHLSEEELQCEEQYEANHQRDQQGRYIVKIPFKEDPSTLGKSKQRAVARLLQLETRFSRDKSLEHNYKQFMAEYIKLGHMEKVPRKERDQGHYYIPHQAVIKEDSTTTKLRVVFDASCKTSTNMSLNSLMHKGPRLQEEITDILVRWRKHAIAFTADIEKMYRQIWIRNEDQDYQRIVWRSNQKHPIDEYRLRTVTYGTTAAPYLAIKTLQRLAEDEKKNYPLASLIVKSDFYVDDLMSGANSLHEAINIQQQLNKLLGAGGFNLRKWSSNNQKFLESLPMKIQDQNTIEITEETTRKTLGLYWNPCKDDFSFKVAPTIKNKLSKRTILSDVARIYDPLGWLTPILIKAKLVIQELWTLHAGWDEEIPSNIKRQWEGFRAQLQQVEEITIPRWVNYGGEGCQVQLHGFSDASEKAYGAAVYIKTLSRDGTSKTQLLVAKSKVAPIKTKKTLPRLELAAAVLLAKLLNRTIEALGIKNVSQYAWTDSMITLAWIQSSPAKWKTFVANRVSEIQQNTPSDCWRHVKSAENPADIITRGIDPLQLKNHQLWWNGPHWLVDNNSWPSTIVTSTVQEIKSHHVKVQQQEKLLSSFQYSSLEKTIRVIAYCQRFHNNCKQHKEAGPLTMANLNNSLQTIIKTVQQEEFSNEIQTIKDNEVLPPLNKISSLVPFLDGDGLLRVGGRLEKSSLSYNEKHPIIIPYDNHITTLIVRDAHQKLLHGGNRITLAYIRRKFWIINGKRAVNKVIHKCITCIRYKSQTCQQLMGDLPTERTTPSEPFTHVGVDYAGPIQLRTTRGRGHKSYKGYIVVFVCFATKAIHLDAVTDMTSEAFLASLRRFVSRRGSCQHMYSDNGTTFVGANKQLQKEISTIVKNNATQDKLTSYGVQWHFIPPAAPHFGGIWEAGVKSVKHHLKRVIGDSKLTYEEMSTLLCQIEACLNSRPLCSLSNDIDTTAALTPGHFLIGRAIITPYDPITSPIGTNVNKRWRLIQKMKREFWSAWSNDYLHELQQRYRWKTSHHNLKVGDIVLIKEANISPGGWPLAKISEVHPAPDGKVRVVSIKTAGTRNSTKKPITKIIRLPISESTERENTAIKAISTNIITTSQDDRSKSSSKGQATIRKKVAQRRPTLKNPFSIMTYLLTIMCLFLHYQPALANYTITYPEPGLFIEHLGNSRIERGTFRIQQQIKKTAIEESAQSVTSTCNKMKDLCEGAKALSDLVHCDTLVKHLSVLEAEVKQNKENINHLQVHRQKRGLLGNLLTSIFGVNDEVYQDIGKLEDNQQKLIQASNHQTKFMISALATFNNTENRINKHLQTIQQKLDQAWNNIREMEKWYKTVDENRLSIQLITTYQLAANYIQEILQQFQNIVEVHENEAHFYEFLSYSEVQEIIETSNKKLPSNIQILAHPILATDIMHEESVIVIRGYFAMVEIGIFDLIKITPLPLRVQKGTYWIMDVSSNLLAINYNNQYYFELSEEELKTSIQTSSGNYLISPMMVQSIENSPNCVIDEIYKREESKCDVHQYNITSLIWKQLYTKNSWLFIAPSSARIAVICNGVREDAVLNSSGIIKISQDCIIKTRNNILTPKRLDNITVLSGFGKAVKFEAHRLQVNTTHHLSSNLPKEMVLQTSDQLNTLRDQEENIQDELEEAQWHHIHHHSLLPSTAVTITIIVIVIIGWKWYRCIKKRRVNRQQSTTAPTEDLVMEPLYSLPGPSQQTPLAAPRSTT